MVTWKYLTIASSTLSVSNTLKEPTKFTTTGSDRRVVSWKRLYKNAHTALQEYITPKSQATSPWPTFISTPCTHNDVDNCVNIYTCSMQQKRHCSPRSAWRRTEQTRIPPVRLHLRPLDGEDDHHHQRWFVPSAQYQDNGGPYSRNSFDHTRATSHDFQSNNCMLP